MKYAVACVAAALTGCAAAGSESGLALDAAHKTDPHAVHNALLTLDSHVDQPRRYATREMDPGGFSEHPVDLPKMRIGGLDAAFFVIFTYQGPQTPEGYADALRHTHQMRAAIDRLVRGYPDQIALAQTSAEIKDIVRRGKKVALIGFENAYPLNEDLSLVKYWRSKGVRYMGITHFGHNQFGDSANLLEEFGDRADQNGGLTSLGRKLIAAMNDAGIVVDASHASKKTALQAISLSRAPVIASHSAIDALVANPRNLDDETMRKIAAFGGVIQIIAADEYIRPGAGERIAYLTSKTATIDDPTPDPDMTCIMNRKQHENICDEADRRWPPATVSDFVNHIDYAVSLVGVDHVGIASDFWGGGGVVGWEDASETYNVTAELLRRGYSQEDIQKIWGGNLMRVLDEVDALSKIN